MWKTVLRYRRTLFALLLSAACATPLHADDAFSPAEQMLFLADHLTNVAKATVLRYSYSKTGTLDTPSEGSVSLRVSAMPQGTGKHAHVDFASGTRSLDLPDIDDATANPVILFFLERDVRDMERRTGGKAAYFRKRVRLAFSESADVQPVQFEFAGRTVSGTQISVHPFTDDPLKSRFTQLADKTYLFMLSPEIPGQLYRMQTQARAPQGSAGTAPLLQESITLIGAQP